MDVDTNQPLGTPTWIDLGVPDLDRALEFYGAVFGWDFAVGPEEYGRYTTCLLRGRRRGGRPPSTTPPVGRAWRVYLATPDCDDTARRARAGRRRRCSSSRPTSWTRGGWRSRATRPARVFGLWQGRAHIGCAGGERARVARAQRPGHPDPRAAPASSTRGLRLHARRQRGHARAPTSRSCAVPTGTRSAASWAPRAARRPGPPRSRSPAPTRRSTVRSPHGGSSDGGDGLPLRAARHDHRPVRRGVLDHHPASVA